ncbi:MAG: DinB family protein [Chloroflexi bacterium]|nr:DinB family protein [Chloroflexota bacterium]MDA1239612.1 DinB family protein [Chloroflexota bacterium]MQC19230.1 DinB family protein [Chloroflexota bacterium]
MTSTTTLTPVTLDILAGTPSALRGMLGGLSEAGANDLRDAGGWSVRDCVAHLLDRAPMQRRRVEAMLGEQHPTLMNEDETASLEASGYRLLPLAILLDRFEALRVVDVQRYRGLTAADFARTGEHSVAGPTTVAEMLNHIAYHDLDHLRQAAATLAGAAHEGRGAMQIF